MSFLSLIFAILSALDFVLFAVIFKGGLWFISLGLIFSILSIGLGAIGAILKNGKKNDFKGLFISMAMILLWLIYIVVSFFK